MWALGCSIGYLQLSNYYPEEGLVKVLGGKNKQKRLVPIGESVIKYIDLSTKTERSLLPVIHKMLWRLFF
ncbi:MAG: hypothetical protein IPJ39_22220 [Saprospiraceae bacterium]|nr:hypothetical protein [Saprospiraceae bacterium]